MKRQPTPRRFLDRARQMRHEDTFAEKLAWVLLRDRRMFGLKFRRQVPIDRFIVDFYCHELRLIIELDGDVHDEPEQMRKDAQRNLRLERLGYKMLHVANGLVMNAPDLFAEKIHAFLPSPGAFLEASPCRARASRRHPLPGGEGHNPGFGSC